MHLKYRVRFLVLTLRQVTRCWGKELLALAAPLTLNSSIAHFFWFASGHVKYWVADLVHTSHLLTGQHKPAVTRNKVLVKSYKLLTSLMAFALLQGDI